MSGKSQTIGDFIVSRLSQILATNENSKSWISPIVWDGRGQIWRIRSVSMFPTHPRFLWSWSAIILNKWKLKFVPSGTLAMDFAHYQLSKLLGFSLPITHLFTNFNFWCTFHFPPNSTSNESRTDFWQLSDTSANSETVGKIPDHLGFSGHMKTRLEQWQWWHQREHQKSNSKTTTLHVKTPFRKMPNFTFYGGRKQATMSFSFSF